jgi:hypothetical protein
MHVIRRDKKDLAVAFIGRDKDVSRLETFRLRRI